MSCTTGQYYDSKFKICVPNGSVVSNEVVNGVNTIKKCPSGSSVGIVSGAHASGSYATYNGRNACMISSCKAGFNVDKKTGKCSNNPRCDNGYENLVYDWKKETTKDFIKNSFSNGCIRNINDILWGKPNYNYKTSVYRDNTPDSGYTNKYFYCGVHRDGVKVTKFSDGKPFQATSSLNPKFAWHFDRYYNTCKDNKDRYVMDPLMYDIPTKNPYPIPYIPN
jgi:hypothetical protein